MTDVQDFKQAFRGYDQQQVDAEVQRLRDAVEQSRRSARAAAQDVQAQAEHHRDDMSAAEQRITRLEGELIEVRSRLQAAESRAEILGREVSEDGEEPRFEEILRVAEEQASALIDNAVAQSERIVADATGRIEKDRKASKEESDRILEAAKHEEAQARIRIETERSAHTAELESREAKHQERVAQAESEASVLISEAERGASALRQQSTAEADALMAEAERIQRESKARQLELDAAAKRRQEEAQQEFLRLHNHAIQHAERITNDANDKVASALSHANHIAEQAQAFEDLSKAQAAHVERQAVAKASAILGEARTRAQAIVESVLGHSKEVLHEAEDRARTLRFQQQQLQGFRAELGQLMAIAESTRAALPTFGDDVAPIPSPAVPAPVAPAFERDDVADLEPTVEQDPHAQHVDVADDLDDVTIVTGEVEPVAERTEGGIVSEQVDVVWHEDRDDDGTDR